MFGPKHTLKSLLQDLEHGLRSGEVKLRDNPPTTFLLAVRNGLTEDPNSYAEELRSHLLKAVPTITVERLSQGFSGTVAVLRLVLEAPAAPAVAKQVSDWLRNRPNASIDLKGEQTHFVAEAATVEDPAWLSKLLEVELAVR